MARRRIVGFYKDRRKRTRPITARKSARRFSLSLGKKDSLGDIKRIEGNRYIVGEYSLHRIYGEPPREFTGVEASFYDDPATAAWNADRARMRGLDTAVVRKRSKKWGWGYFVYVRKPKQK
jgi:hypothetical protein